jgi:hypothetical protein
MDEKNFLEKCGLSIEDDFEKIKNNLKWKKTVIVKHKIFFGLNS